MRKGSRRIGANGRRCGPQSFAGALDHAARPFSHSARPLRRIGGVSRRDILVPGGLYDKLTKTGWKASPTGTNFKYKNPLGASGITQVGIKLVTGKDGVMRAKVKV
jgi:hypothetical protein